MIREFHIAFEAMSPRLMFSVSSAFEPPRIIEFAGVDWMVARQDTPAAGENLYSDADDSVWVDAEGLHLKLQRDPVAGLWQCASVSSLAPTEPGTHRFHITGRPDMLDDNVQFSLSVLGEGGAAAVEFAGRGWAGSADDTRFSLLDASGQRQPLSQQDPAFPTDLNGTASVWELGLQADGIDFLGYRGSGQSPATPEHIISTGRYDGAADLMAGDMFMRIDLSLVDALPPADGNSVEIIIADLDAPNHPPRMGSLQADDDWLLEGETATVTAAGVSDIEGHAIAVEFYLHPQTDGPGTLLGVDDDGLDGWSWTGPATWTVGDHVLRAVAIDALGAAGAPHETTIHIAPQPDFTVTIGDGDDSMGHSLTYFDPDGQLVRISMRRGSAELGFIRRQAEVQPGQDNVHLSAGGVHLSTLDIDATSGRSALVISRKGEYSRVVDVDRFTISGELRTLRAPDVRVSGGGLRIAGDGHVRSVALGSLANGANIEMKGSGPRGGTRLKIAQVEAGSLIDLGVDRVRSARFGEFAGTFVAGVDAGDDGQWFTEDDNVVKDVRVDALRVARPLRLGDAGPGENQAWGFLLAPQRRDVLGGLETGDGHGWGDDKQGFHARALPTDQTTMEIDEPGQVKRNGLLRLTGRVMDGPYRYLHVFVTSEDAEGERLDRVTAWTDGKGRWRADVVPGDSYTVELCLGDKHPLRQRFDRPVFLPQVHMAVGPVLRVQ